MEYCEGGDLSQFMKRQPHGVVAEALARHLIRELADGLHALWRQNLIHRDLKPQNLLLADTSPVPRLKIADFGFARHLATASLAETLCGSPLYMAPEIMRFHKYDSKADLWSVGTILYEMIFGRTPFHGATQMELLRNIERYELRFPENHNVPRDCIELMQGLLRRDPSRRMGFEEFFAHPYIGKEYDMTKSIVVPPTTTSSPPNSIARTVTAPLDIQRRVPDGLPTHTSPPTALLQPLSLGSSTRLQESYRSSVMQSYRRRSASTSQHRATSLSIHQNSPTTPMSPELVASPTPRINPFKSSLSSTPPPTSAFAFTASSAPSHFSSKQSSLAVVPRPKPNPVIEYTCDTSLDMSYQRIQTMMTIAEALLSLPGVDTTASYTSSASSSSSTHSISSPTASSDLDTHPEARRQASALQLYLMCLHFLQHAYAIARRNVAARAWINELLNVCLDRAEQCKKYCGPLLLDAALPSGEDVLYYHAMRLGRDGAVQEVLGQWPHALELYERARVLLDSILAWNELKKTSSTALSIDDKQRIAVYVEGFAQRIQCVASKQEP
ncbi:ULK/ULK protein kinase [Saprolegnia parasitica CBS 223.65]|uniref:ULK/ULK protein kinase n=1 Tax=Saprolegnia parasitica (strain CBS 223.65) TaxID=695850 RepID=A0A067BR52_SAPPC|nr:ULK/ULK protein kinase [Saprolegnia parasitica CBS 223.65]KDO19265.1 ULK/ULK protein kinase [Saprolegnia parasitica CBS 223.65]|eukprot:XP_012210039.1 ULK/ULK protein kinase [Saprolegnia parasitica CBS 223.65]